jgi:nucleotide-binding universal stress UspA family protein
MTFAPKKILVPVAPFADEGPELANLAVTTATDVAKAFGSRLHILAVVPPLMPLGGIDFSGQNYQVLVDAHKAQIKKTEDDLGELTKLAADSGVEATIQVVDSDGPVAELICKTGEAEEADLIAIPSHGRKGLKRLFLGSVAERVAHLSDAPVLLLRLGEGAQAG